MLIRKIKTNKGFSILEILILISVILVSLTGLISLSIGSIKSQTNSRNALVAVELAQEGIEIVRNIRDTNWLNLSSSDWNSNLGNGNYIVNYGSTALSSVSGINDNAAKLYIDSNNMYTHTGGTSTAFSRIITINSTDDASSTISSFVKFGSGPRSQIYEVDAILYNWH